MISFENDYSEGCHELILQRLMETNVEQETGYGFDSHSLKAKELIKKQIDNQDAEIYFISGGTQTNSIVISTMLQNYEGVISAETGHINVHEAGAIERHGHKVLSLPSHNGKLDAKEVKAYLANFYRDGSYDHMVFPGMVYISQPTEYGTLYSKKELTDLYQVCNDYTIPLFIDGARLGYALMSPENDVSLKELSKLCDVFYIGATKVGALLGEAVVFTKKNTPKYFMTQIKQMGALLAKGRVLGIQFEVLFEDNLYFKIAENAIKQAEKIKEYLKTIDNKVLLSPTNQQFLVLSNKQYESISKKVKISNFENYDENHIVARICTSWHTTDKQVEELIQILKEEL